MTISGLAHAGGVGVETIRYYQRRGLLCAPPGSGLGSRGAVRRYGDADVARLRFIRSAKGAGFTLDEIAELLRLDGARDRASVRALARRRLAHLDAVLADLGAARAWLAALEADCASGTTGPCPILTAFEDAAARPS